MMRLTVTLSILLLVGCSSFPEKLQVSDVNTLVTYQDAANSAQTKGKTVRWGGAIASVENKQDSTTFEIVHYPLNRFGRPIADSESIGRFRVNVNGFMDPMVYKTGRLITYTGQLTGNEKGMVGEHEYVFPVVESNAYYLWKNVQRVQVNGFYPWPIDYWYHPRFYHHRTFVRGHRGANTTGQDSTKIKVTNYQRPINTKRVEQ